MKDSPSDHTSLPIACLDRNRLRDYLAGCVDETSSSAIESHLSQCPACEDLLVDVEQESDPIVSSLHHYKANPSALDPMVEASIQNAKQIAQVEPTVNRASTPLLLQPGNDLGPYQLVKPLGRGGMGMVYLAKHRKLNKEVAIKLLPSAFVSKDVQARFEREILAAGQLRHPSIVSATDAGQADGIQYLVMEFVDGLDLGQIARAVSSISIPDICEIGRQIALGLSFAHATGMVHRDIKPSNVMLDASGAVKLLDFGLVLLDRWDGAASELTTIGQFLGTLDYMAPEQAERCGTVDYRADLYSLGATLFRLLCGRAPLAAAPNQSPLEKLRLLANHHAPSLKTLRPDAPEPLVQLVDQLLATKPEDRPPSAAHVAEQLQKLSLESELKSLLELALANDVERSSDSQASRPFGFGIDRQTTVGVSQQPPRNRRRWMAAAASLPFLFFAGYWIVLETNKGQLVIDSEVADVQVKILRDGEPVREMDIQTGSTTTRLRADKYEITLKTPSDKLSIENGQFQLKHGETIVARIRNTPPILSQPGTLQIDSQKPAVTPGTLSTKERQPMYEGKTFDEWFESLKYDRSMRLVDNAFDGVKSLVTPERQREVDQVVLKLFSEDTDPIMFQLYLIERPAQNLVPLLDAFDRFARPPLGAIAVLFQHCIPNDSKTWDPFWEWLEKRMNTSDPNLKIEDAVLIQKIFMHPHDVEYAITSDWFQQKYPEASLDTQVRFGKRLIRLLDRSPALREATFTMLSKIDRSRWSEQELETMKKAAEENVRTLPAYRDEILYSSLCVLIGDDFSRTQLDKTRLNDMLDGQLIRYSKELSFRLPFAGSANTPAFLKAPSLPGSLVSFGNAQMSGMRRRNGEDADSAFFIVHLFNQIERFESEQRPIAGLQAIVDASRESHDAFQKTLANRERDNRSDRNLSQVAPPLTVSWPSLAIDREIFEYYSFDKDQRYSKFWSYFIHRWAMELLRKPMPKVVENSEPASGIDSPSSKPSTAPPQNPNPEPVYQGKTFDEWFLLMKRERANVEQVSICKAIYALYNENLADEIDDAVLELYRTQSNVEKDYFWLLSKRPSKNLPAMLELLEGPLEASRPSILHDLCNTSIVKDNSEWDVLWGWIEKQLNQDNELKLLTTEVFLGVVLPPYGEGPFRPFEQSTEEFRTRARTLIRRLIPLMSQHTRIRDTYFGLLASRIDDSSPSDQRDGFIQFAMDILKSDALSRNNLPFSLELLQRQNKMDAIEPNALRDILDRFLIRESELPGGLEESVMDYGLTKFTFDDVTIDLEWTPWESKREFFANSPWILLLLLHINRMDPAQRPTLGLKAIADATISPHDSTMDNIIHEVLQTKGDTKIYFDIWRRCYGIGKGGFLPTKPNSDSRFVPFLIHRWAKHLLGIPAADPAKRARLRAAEIAQLPKDADNRYAKYSELIILKQDQNYDFQLSIEEWNDKELAFIDADKNGDGFVTIAEYYASKTKKAK